MAENNPVTAPADPPPPLELAYFEEHSESFSARIVRELKDSTFFRPKLRRDGSVTDKDMLMVAGVVIAASDLQIREAERRREMLERRMSEAWWNKRMFEPALPAPDGNPPPPTGPGSADDAPVAETNWFARHLTLRNLGSVLVLVVSAVWVFFTWYTSDKNEQLAHVKSLLESSERRAADTEKSKEQLEKDFGFIKEHGADQAKEIEALKAAAAGQKAKSEELAKSLAAERSEKIKLLDLLKVAQQRPASGAKP